MSDVHVQYAVLDHPVHVPPRQNSLYLTSATPAPTPAPIPAPTPAPTFTPTLTPAPATTPATPAPSHSVASNILLAGGSLTHQGPGNLPDNI